MRRGRAACVRLLHLQVRVSELNKKVAILLHYYIIYFLIFINVMLDIF
jgi:hypothetical protein